MKDSVSIVNEGLDALGNKAKSAVDKLISTFSGAAGKAKMQEKCWRWNKRRSKKAEQTSYRTL